MSLLWPEYVTLGVFPGACWLQRGGVAEVPAEAVVSPAADNCLDAVDALLERHAGSLGRRARVEVVVSDTLGRTIALPWQAGLTSSSETRAYARMLLEAQGGLDGPSWSVQAAYRHFGAPGFGAALPEDWLNELAQRLSARGLRLRGALPLSAVAYWQTGRMANGDSLLLLEEGSRITALVYRNRRLRMIEVQPVYGDSAESGERLCRRVQALYGAGAVRDAVLWSLSDGEALSSAVRRCWPDAGVQRLPLGHWRRA